MIRSLVRTLLVLGLAAAAPAEGQLIHLRTVPVASGDQFLWLPSARLAMGGVSIAVDDSLADAWTEPAKGVFVDAPAFLGAPTFYGISGGGGGGRTLPVAGLARGPGWAGGLAVALQEIDNSDDRFRGWDVLTWAGAPERLTDRSARNVYARAFVAWRLGEGPWSLGIGASAASLRAMDGVDLLYANASSIDQEGSVKDVRLGLFRQGTRDRVAVDLLHHRVSMTHELIFLDWPLIDWAPGRPFPPVARLEVEEERTRTWAGSVAWERSLEAPGWRMGGKVTFNRKSHPKIPNYDIQNIPRDPGDSWAWEAGLGASRRSGPSLFAMELAVQPVRSDTWQVAEDEILSSNGRRFFPGDRTIDNEFTFLNVFLRSGWEYATERATFQLGIEARSYQYDLKQRNYLVDGIRNQDEAWMEWTPSFGASYDLDGVELRYLGRITTGTGRPGTAFPPESPVAMDAASDFLVAPLGPLTLQDATVVTHQVAVRVPVR